MSVARSDKAGDAVGESGTGKGSSANGGAGISSEGNSGAAKAASSPSSGDASTHSATPGTGEASLSGPGKYKLEVGESITHIALPKNGKFGVVIVGSEPVEEYPEAHAAWAGRLAYSVYLHVGLAKNWILQLDS
jgi:hypothetical protein